MIVGGYSLHLYCDHSEHAVRHPTKYTSLDAEFAGPNESDCMKQARKKGWLFKRNYIVICPDCPH